MPISWWFSMKRSPTACCEMGEMGARSCLNPTTETSLIIPPIVAESSGVAKEEAARAAAESVAKIVIPKCFCLSKRAKSSANVEHGAWFLPKINNLQK